MIVCFGFGRQPYLGSAFKDTPFEQGCPNCSQAVRCAQKPSGYISLSSLAANDILKKRILCIITAASFTLSAGHSQAESVLNLIIENDVFTGTDRHYTSGVMLNYISGVQDGPRRLRELGIRFPGVDPDDRMHVSVSIGHEIYTPTNIASEALLEDERPYAGHAYLAAGFSTANRKEIETWQLTTGIVGPAAKGEYLQNTLHRAIESDLAMGWSHELDNEWVFALAYEKKWLNRAWTRAINTGVEIDFIPHFAAAIGTLHNYAGLGGMLRLGQGLQADHGPPKVRPSMPNSQYFAVLDHHSWYMFIGVEGRYVASNLFLDGNHFSASHSVSRKDWVADLQAGFVWTNRKFRVGYTYYLRSREFTRQEEPDIFGSLTLSAHF